MSDLSDVFSNLYRSKCETELKDIVLKFTENLCCDVSDVRKSHLINLWNDICCECPLENKNSCIDLNDVKGHVDNSLFFNIKFNRRLGLYIDTKYNYVFDIVTKVIYGRLDVDTNSLLMLNEDDVKFMVSGGYKYSLRYKYE